MLPLTRKPIDRRKLLRGVTAAVGLPLLEAMSPKRLYAAPSTYKPAERSVGPQPRMICCYVPNGVSESSWLPSQSGSNWELSSSLKPLEKVKSQVSVLTGIGHPNSIGGHEGADTWLTGASLKGTPGKDYQNSISVDQIAATVHGEQTRFPSIELSEGGGAGPARHSHTLSFDRSGTPVPTENNPQRYFDRLFAAGDAATRETTLRRYAERRSILDEVMSEANGLSNQLGKSDRRKLDEYLTSVREVERRVTRLQDWVDIPRPQVETDGLQLSSKPLNNHDYPMWVDVMLEISYLAFLTDTTRVITFEWAREASGRAGGENHHELSHHNGDAKILQRLAKVDTFNIERLGRFLEFLQATADGDDANMLDNTMVLYGSGMSNGKGGGHSPKNLPLLLAGGKRLGIRQGQHLTYNVDSLPMSNVLLTMLRGMGIDQPNFADSTGVVSDLMN